MVIVQLIDEWKSLKVEDLKEFLNVWRDFKVHVDQKAKDLDLVDDDPDVNRLLANHQNDSKTYN